MDKWIEFLKTLAAPSDFRNDPYAEATNQLSHMVVGCIASAASCILWFVAFGEMPVKYQVILAVCLGYALLIEAWLQGWKGQDSLADTFFVSCGAMLALSPFREMSFTPDLVILEFRPKFLGLLLLVVGLALALHLWPRIKRRYNAG